HATEVDPDDLVKFVDFVFVSGRQLSFDPGVVEESIDATEIVQRRLHIASGRRFVGDIGKVSLETLRRCARVLPSQFHHPPVKAFFVDIDQQDRGTLTSENFAGGEANGARRAGDDNRLAFVAHHVPPLRNGSVIRNQASFGVSSLRKLRASSGVSVAAIGIVPKTLPLSTRSVPWRSILLICMSSDLSAA